ncbi:phage portal protein [Emticicia fontis]
MGLKSQIRNWLGLEIKHTQIEKRSASLSDGEGFLKMLGIDPINVTVTPETALGLSALYRCVWLIASSIAVAPKKIFKEELNGDTNVDKNHPLYTLFYLRPNRHQSSFVFWLTAWTHVLIYGNCVIEMVAGQYGRPKELKILLPWEFSFMETASGEMQILKNTGKILIEEDFIHLQDLSLDGKIGKSRVGLIRNSLKTQMRAEAFLDKYYEKGTFTNGYLQADKKLTQADMEEASNAWDDNFGGIGNNFRTPVLSFGTKYESIAKSNVESQLMEFLNAAPTKIYQVYGVPPHLASDTTKSTSFGKGIEDLMIQFCQFTLLPLTVQAEQEINYKAFRTNEIGTWYVKHNLDVLLRADFKSRMEGFAQAIQNGVMSPNDARKLNDMNQYTGGETYMVNGNMQRVEDVASGNSIMNKNNENSGQGK